MANWSREAKQNIIECTSCGTKLLSPFVPTPGKRLECPDCMILHNDMAESAYVKNLINFLKRRGYIITVTLAKGRLYDVIGAKKGEEP